MKAELCEKVEISRILIQRVEGLPSKARVSSIQAANSVLERWADCASDSGNDQCDFQIIFEDGFWYRGHYRLNQSKKRISLSRYVRKQLAAIAMATGDKDPPEMDDEPIISLIGTDRAESARIALDHYDI